VSWQIVGAVAEGASAVGVLMTLAYLAVQVREARRLLLAEAHRNRTDRKMLLFSRFSDSAIQRCDAHARRPAPARI